MRRNSRVGIILILLISAYSALWIAVHVKIRSTILTWKSAELDAGRIWMCGKQSIGGFPLQIVLTCEKPTFEIFGAKPFRITTDLLQLETHVFSPTQINFLIHQNLSLQLPHQTANMSFEQLTGFMKWSHSSAWELQITGQKFVLFSGLVGLRDWTGSTLGSIVLRISDPGTVNTTPRALNVAADIRDARPAAQNVLTLNGGALDGKLLAQLTHWDLAEKNALVRLERWRMEGGLLLINQADVLSNGSGIGLSGSFRLDDLRRIDGKGTVKFSDGLILTNAVRSLSGGTLNLGFGAPKTANTSRPRPLQAPITLSDGKVYVGPIDTKLRTYPLY